MFFGIDAVPDVRTYSPIIASSRVDLPDPTGPITTVNVLGSSVTEISLIRVMFKIGMIMESVTGCTLLLSLVSSTNLGVIDEYVALIISSLCCPIGSECVSISSNSKTFWILFRFTLWLGTGFTLSQK